MKLERWQARPFSRGAELGPQPGDARDEYELEIAREAPGAPERDGPHRRAAAAIARYDIFPPELLTPVLERAPVRPGDTVGARYRFAPGVELAFASRVVEVFDGFDSRCELHCAGFTYRTLEGHPEFGEETFCVEKHPTSGRVSVALRSWSRPGTTFTRLSRLVMRRIQVQASRRALTHLAGIVRQAR